MQAGSFDQYPTHTMEVNKPYIGKIANSLKKAQSKANGVHDPAQTECNQANIVHTILVRTKLQCW